MLSVPFVSISQVSETNRMAPSYYYVAKESIIKNYDGKNNFIMSYGCKDNEYGVLNLCEKSSFFIQSDGEDHARHIVDLPYGYKVNDMDFVYLKMKDDNYYEPFLCFCGTRIIRYDYYYPIIRDSSVVTIIPVTEGFVGYFKVNNAISPSISDSAVLRSVECCKELSRMICYAEQNGAFCSQQSTYRDNAVLDIIGTTKKNCDFYNCSHNNLSALWRVKFYPQFPYMYYPSGTHWDNNIRFNDDNAEKIIDLCATNDYVVTVSQPSNSNTNFWLRFSNKETYHFSGGMELNNTLLNIDLSTLQINNNSISNSNLTYFRLPIRLSHMYNNTFSFAFNSANQESNINGIFVFKKDIDQPAINPVGFYDHVAEGLTALTYLPVNSASVYLFDAGIRSTLNTGITYWDFSNNNSHTSYHYYSDTINLSSICTYTFGNEYISWSGENNSANQPPYLLRQKVHHPLGNIGHCQSLSNTPLERTFLNMEEDHHDFKIMERYPDKQDVFKVTKIAFNPYLVNIVPICRKY